MLRMLLAVLAAVLLIGTAMNADAIPPRTRPVRNEPVNAIRQLIALGVQQTREKNATAASATFGKAISAPAFGQLPDDERYRALTIASAVAGDAHAYENSLAWSTRACAFPAATANADLWHVRLEAAYRLENYPDSARSVAAIARQWPDTVTNLNTTAINRIASNLKHDPALAEVRFELLSGLFDARWTPYGQQPGFKWLELTRNLIDRGNIARASAVASRIDDPYAVAALRSNRQFDVLPRVDETTFDVEHAKRTNVALAEHYAQEHPRELLASVEVLYALLATMQEARALRVADELIASIGAGDGKKAYDDFDDQYAWILDSRAAALWQLGRQDDAIEQMRHAARRPEQGQLNVSQSINLAGYYARRGQVDKALDAMADLGQLSPYGRMQREAIGVIDATQRKDGRSLDAHLDFMKTHKDDALATYQSALLDADRLDAAATLLIERLRDPGLRSDAIGDMQRYASTPAPPLVQARRARWLAVIARADVQAALAPVGRVEQVALQDPNL